MENGQQTPKIDRHFLANAWSLREFTGTVNFLFWTFDIMWTTRRRKRVETVKRWPTKHDQVGFQSQVVITWPKRRYVKEWSPIIGRPEHLVWNPPTQHIMFNNNTSLVHVTAFKTELLILCCGSDATLLLCKHVEKSHVCFYSTLSFLVCHQS